MHTCRKRLLIVLLQFLCLVIVPFVAQAITITICNFDKDTYHQGEIGFATVTIYNDKDNIIRVTELTATIDYYYNDGTIYLQKFFTNATLPVEIQQGQTSTFHIPFSLPTNIASGYTEVDVKANTELWNGNLQRWSGLEHSTYQQTLYIESPYKQQLDEQQTINDQLEDQLDQQQTANEQLEGQLEEQMTINKNVTNMMYLLGITTIVSAAVVVFLFVFNRRARVPTQPIT